MKEEKEKKGQLSEELKRLRKRVAELEQVETERLSAEQAGKQVEERIKHLNLVLRVIRCVNQLIVKERDRDRLLQGACDRLIETRGYYNIWITLLDESGGLVTTAEAGLGEDFIPMLEQLKRGELTTCGKEALAQSGVVVTEDPASACADCPLSANYGGRGALTVRLEHGGKVYGLLSASIPAHLTTDEEEQVLFEEVSGDIAFALRNIELEEERVRAEEVLQRRTKELATLNAINQDITASLDLDKTLQRIADSTRRLTGAKRSRILLINLQAHQLLRDVISGYPPEEKETYDYEQFEQGISGWAVLEKRSNLVPDVLADERSVGRSRAASVRRGTKSVAVAPLMVRGEVIGTLTAVNLREDPIFTQEDIALVEQLATQAAIAIENARLYEAAQQEITEHKRAERLLRALNQAATAMERALTPEKIFTTVAEELKKLGFSCVILLTDESQKGLLPKYLSYEAKAIKAAEKLVGFKAEGLSIPVETVEVYDKVIRERKTVFVEDAEEVVRQLLPGPAKRLAKQIAKMLKVSKSIDAPLIAEDEVIGLLLVQSDDLTEDDMPAITAFAHQMAAAWRKASLLQDLEGSLAERTRAEEELRQSYANLQRTLEETVHALASAVEMRDPYTAGHQRRVTELACAIATEMGLPQERIEGLRMAGLIHDIGKINVPAEILSKPGPLNTPEFALIKAHPQVGHDILKEIDFPWPVAQIVLQHHERLDGSGYPQGLQGEEMLLEARILAVADVVEAMASRRPYRSVLGIGNALEEIKNNKGVRYDSKAVDACLRLFAEDRFHFEE